MAACEVQVCEEQKKPLLPARNTQAQQEKAISLRRDKAGKGAQRTLLKLRQLTRLLGVRP